ncbi:MAG: hypothetical protein OSJ52_07020 [Lachnospiraceae bacterium]|jgi:putative aldouronate transport system substrate-binding protein|nr:hypothetical protein [Lachnospiraceae bacterium]
MSEILEFARQVKEKDPGNLRNKLVPIAVSSSNAELFFIGRNSTWGTSADNMFYRGEDGRFQWGSADADTFRGLKKIYHNFHVR